MSIENKIARSKWVRGKHFGNNIKFEIPGQELYCPCGTTNFIYNTTEEPYKCIECGELLEVPPDSDKKA